MCVGGPLCLGWVLDAGSRVWSDNGTCFDSPSCFTLARRTGCCRSDTSSQARTSPGLVTGMSSKQSDQVPIPISSCAKRWS
jgi:hypothetical protein